MANYIGWKEVKDLFLNRGRITYKGLKSVYYIELIVEGFNWGAKTLMITLEALNITLMLCFSVVEYTQGHVEANDGVYDG